MVVIPNGVPAATTEHARTRRDEAPLRAAGRPPGRASWDRVCRMVEGKGYPTFVRAARLILDQEPDVGVPLLRLRGGPRFRQRLVALAGEVGIGDRAVFTSYPGPVGDVLRSPRRLCPRSSEEDSSPIGVHEAMSVGLPIVASRTSAACPSWSRTRSTRVAGPAGRPGARWPTRSSRLRHDPGLADRLARNASARFLQRHLPDQMARAHEDAVPRPPAAQGEPTADRAGRCSSWAPVGAASTLVHEMIAQARARRVGVEHRRPDGAPAARRAAATDPSSGPCRPRSPGRAAHASRPSEGLSLPGSRGVPRSLARPYRDLLASDAMPWLAERLRALRRTTGRSARRRRCSSTSSPVGPGRGSSTPSSRRHGSCTSSATGAPWPTPCSRPRGGPGSEGPSAWPYGPVPPTAARYQDSFVGLAGLTWAALIDAFEAAAAEIPSDRWLEVRYEDLVSAPEDGARRVLAFCGLDWTPSFESQFARLSFSTSRAEAFRTDLDPRASPCWRTSSGPGSAASATSESSATSGAVGLGERLAEPGVGDRDGRPELLGPEADAVVLEQPPHPPQRLRFGLTLLEGAHAVEVGVLERATRSMSCRSRPGRRGELLAPVPHRGQVAGQLPQRVAPVSATNPSRTSRPDLGPHVGHRGEQDQVDRPA